MVYGYGNSPAVFRNTDPGKALRIASASTGAGSSIEVSGSAVKDVLGDSVTDRYFTVAGSAGAPGSAGYVYGWGDIADTGSTAATTKLGARLGNCTVVNKTLSVTVDGGAPIVITFNQNYTAQTNATIIAAINAVLGAAAVASEFMPGARYRPFFADEEQGLIAAGGAIAMGTVCAFDGNHRKIRPMTSADPSALFAGVAWEDLIAGRSGRVKRRGFLPIADILRTDVAAFVYGDTFSIDPGNPGKIVKGGAQGLFPAIRSDAVQVQ